MPVSRSSARLKFVSTAVAGLSLLVVQAAAAPVAESVSATGYPAAQATSAASVQDIPSASTAPATTSAATTLTPSAPSSTATSSSSASTASRAATASRATQASASTTSATEAASAADASATALATATATGTSTTRGMSSNQKATGTYSGWTADWTENFNVPIDQTKWVAYGYGGQAPGQGAMGLYKESNAFTSNGSLVLRTQYQSGAWSSAGISSGDFEAVSGGRWEVRAKFPQSKGIGYAFLLYPDDGTWPPEFDLAEGRVNGPEIDATYHWGTQNYQDLSILQNADMHSWHTYGVIIGSNTISWTFDGTPWRTITNSSVTTKKMWIGFQCGAMDPKGSAKAYETVDNGVPGPLTPAVSDIQIDWVAHYTKS